ncbi:MAG: 2-oxoacid ferredoxin oxidoreductase, partial [Candidatus Heimdallarchaeaceae archaeon]
LSPCITFNKNQTFDYFRQKVYKVEDTGHDKENFSGALDLGSQVFIKDKIPIGIFYQIEHKTTYEERDYTLNQGIIPAHAPLDLTDEQIEAITEEFY